MENFTNLNLDLPSVAEWFIDKLKLYFDIKCCNLQLVRNQQKLCRAGF